MFTKGDIEKYFLAEKQAGFIGIWIAAALLVAGGLFFFYLKTNIYKGAAIPLFLVGMLFVIAGFTIYKRSDNDRVRMVYAYDLNPGELKDKELPRMKKVMRNFIVYRYTEIFLIALGLGAFFYFRNNEAHFFWKGLGLSLAIIALFILVIDLSAEKRGRTYTDGLQSFVSQK